MILATAETLPQRARAAHAQSPGVIVVGQVCAYAGEMDWFGRLPLKGKQVIVTRPRERAGTLAQKLRELGAEVTEFPCIETVPLTPCPALEEALAHISEYEWLAFTSPAGVAALMGHLDRAGRDVRALGNIKLAAIGPGTAGELKNHGLWADLVPETYDGAHLGAALCGQKPQGKVLLLRAKAGSPALPEALAAAGIPCDDVACYETRYPCPNGEQVRALLEQGAIVTFTSASTVKGFAAALGEGADLSRVTAACIGPQTEAEARQRGLFTITANQATMDSLVARIMEEN